MKIFIFLLIALILAGGAWFFIQTMTTPNVAINPNSNFNLTTSPSPTIGLSQTYSNSTLGFSFNYPTGWKVDESAEGQVQGIELKSPRGFTTLVTYGPSGVGGRCDNDPNTTLGSETVRSLGQDVHVFFVGNKNNNTISSAYVLNSAEPCHNIPFISIPAFGRRPESLLRIEMFYGQKQEKPAAEFTGEDFQTAKAILGSAKLNLL